MAANLNSRNLDWTELVAVCQKLVHASRENPKRLPDYVDIRNFVIFFNTALRAQLPTISTDAMRSIRIQMYRILTSRGEELQSTYDIPLNEIQALKSYLFQGSALSEQGSAIFEGLAKALETAYMEP